MKVKNKNQNLEHAHEFKKIQECCGSVSGKAVWDCESMMAYFLRLSGMYSGQKKESGRTEKLIGRGSYVISLSRYVEGAECSPASFMAGCNGKLVHANLFGYNTRQLQLTPEVKTEGYWDKRNVSES